jgi:hypothetical protein
MVPDHYDLLGLGSDIVDPNRAVTGVTFRYPFVFVRTVPPIVLLEVASDFRFIAFVCDIWARAVEMRSGFPWTFGLPFKSGSGLTTDPPAI